VSRPLFIVIAGANGAGKSTMTGGEPADFASSRVIDPDAIARHIQVSKPGLSDIAAGREALSQISKSMEKQHNLIIETTLSGKSYLRKMEEARRLGYFVMLFYIGTANVEINLSRIADRVALGFHSVPESDVRRRYLRSLENLPRAVKLAEFTALIDNSNAIGYEVIGIADKTINEGAIRWAGQIPAWAKPLA
jgi:predicted ABC-type ATPase